jgi:hypothetical protein
MQSCGGYLYDTQYNSQSDELEQREAVLNNVNRLVQARGASYGGMFEGEGINKSSKAYKKFLKENDLRNNFENWNIFLASHMPKKSRKSKAKKGVIPKQLKPWHAHVKKVRAMKKHKNKTYKEVIEEAKKLWDKM